ncbi:MAG: hypothetical protein RBR23_10020 [Arcobacteraceae bacterium]|jgi:hypothetical protein|nr:hypothetical protein [Arcobacteraceae bacterium]
MQLKINKAKTRPIQIEPWFFRYLNEGQLKVVAAILAHADVKDRQSNSFPSNRVIAFYAGFGLIEKNSRAYKTYLELDDENRKIFKEKRTKNAIQTVKNIKKSLEEIGLLKKEIVGQKGKQVAYMTLDLEWKKETYLNDFDEYFNNIVDEAPTTTKEDITKELQELTKLSDEGNISKQNLADRLQDILSLLEIKSSSSSPVPEEDIEKVANHIMTSKAMQEKIDKGEIHNQNGYKASVISSIRTNNFNGVEKYYNGLVEKEKDEMLDTLKLSLENNENTISYQKFTLNFKDLKIVDDVFIATYQTQDEKIKKDFIVSYEKVKHYIYAFNYTKVNKQFLENYKNNIINYQRQFKNGSDTS